MLRPVTAEERKDAIEFANRQLIPTCAFEECARLPNERAVGHASRERRTGAEATLMQMLKCKLL